MMIFDPSQQRVLDLDPRRHARVLGAPGSGKTVLLVESFARAIERDGWSDSDVLVLAPSRLVASQLRGRIERKLRRAMGGAPVRTGTSFAFSVLARSAAVTGGTPPRLLTGQVLDDAISEIVQARLEAGRDGSGSELSPEVLLSSPFRAELRELWRVLDDFGFAPSELAFRLREIGESAQSDAFTAAPDSALIGRWIEGLSLLHEVAGHLAIARPEELSPSALLRKAKAAVLAGDVAVPRLLLVDDAQDLGEGELALLAACATVGSAVWVFGDPDTATGAFQGEGTRVLSGLNAELERRGWKASPNLVSGSATKVTEATVVLETVYRHGPVIRELVRSLSDRIGVAGGGLQRVAVAADLPTDRSVDQVQFARIDTPSDQLGAVAHRMRARRLGLEAGRDALDWNEMAVVCRTRGEAVRVARLLAGHQVPTGVTAGGVVLREHQIVRELIALVQHVLGLGPLDATGVLRLAGGVVGGLDPVAVRRLRSALLVQERRDARAEVREPDPIERVVFEAFEFPGSNPVIDSAGGRTIRKLGLIVREATQVHVAGGTAREVLWALWDGTKLAERWQQDALAGRGLRAAEAGRSLDAVMGLFFVLQRHEEQDSKQPIAEVLDEMLRSTVPEDSLAQQGSKQAVTVTTPQGVVGREFAFVAILGPQEGTWPNLRARGSLLGTAALERWLRGGEAQAPSRRDTIHDELRLFLHACARTREELLVVAVADEDNYPSPFFGFGKQHAVTDLPSARLTLRGVTAAMRRRAVAAAAVGGDDSDGDGLEDDEVLASLAALAAAGVPGAHPDEWYGVLPPSTTSALFTAAEGEDPRQIPVSPSQLERAETCALDWVISSLGGGAGSMQASLGTLVHHALETAEGHDPEQILKAITAEWRKLPFDAEWESERARRTAATMAAGLADYLSTFAASGKQLLGRESSFSIDIGRATLRGVADRLELHETPQGAEITVIDLKTGRTPVSGPGAEEHVQLQAYQLGAALGAFEYSGTEPSDSSPAGNHPIELRTAAKLLYVHPDATRGKGYIERVQSELSEDAKVQLSQRVTDVAETMAAGEFTARIEHHCSDPHQPGNCRLHIIQAVSHA